ncbi:hypothetical protein F5878DRAFT_663933 [Lentinula raphanica]|uniref:Uncharacterized protein n=1 Tax=Lentinula raphanica TaxID=153919 RepID=A0AA38P306_9AGAR|nr:hypothetical protein F5878DRAFT_663933 [Lentinula raphanica]
MESPISLADISQSPPSETLDLPSNVDDSTPSAPNTNPSHTLGGEWGDTSSDAWGSGWGEPNTGWGHSYTSNWGTEYLTRSSVLQTVRSDFSSANLTATGTDDRNPSLDDLHNEAWSSIQLYRSSEQGRKDHAPFPTFTLPQVEQRFQQVQASIRIRLREKEVLANEIEAMAQNLADKKKKAKEIEDKLVSLKFSVEELRDLHLIAHARLP